MRKEKVISMLLIILTLVLLVSGCGEQAPNRTAKPGSQEEKPGVILVTDGRGKEVKVPYQPKRIVSLNSSASEIVFALGGADRLVGRDSYSIFPPVLTRVPELAKSSSNPSLEALVQAHPDLILADTMLKEDQREKLNAAGIAVLIDSPSDPERALAMIQYMGDILGQKERATQVIQFIEKYERIIADRIKKLDERDKPKVYFEWYKPYHSAGQKSVFNKFLVVAGGVNIAAQEKVDYPTVNPEWVATQNPDIIVRRDAGQATKDKFKGLRDEIIQRPELRNVKAVKEQKVYIIASSVTSGIRSVVGHLYLAKWFHPDLFQDVDPAAVHRQMLKEFFDLEPAGTWVYPEK